jgi:hypothetical protein
MSDDTRTPEPTPAPAEETLTQTVLHQEYVIWHWHDLDACLWRFWRAIGFTSIPETFDALWEQARGLIAIRAATHGDRGYTLGTLITEEGRELPRYHLHGAIKLLPQLNGTTLVQVYMLGSTGDAMQDQTQAEALIESWQAARRWMTEHAGGQPAPQRGRPVAVPRRAQTS